jgi:hypothetical protein
VAARKWGLAFLRTGQTSFAFAVVSSHPKCPTIIDDVNQLGLYPEAPVDTNCDDPHPLADCARSLGDY